MSQAIIDSFPCCDTHDGMANNIPNNNMDEVQTVICHIAGNKVNGSSGILPKMVKVCSGDFLEYLVKFFTHVWDSS